MTTPSGTIKASDIRNEFGEEGSGTVRLGAYRVAENRGELTLAIGDGVPTTGAISYGNMRNKRLNIVVDYYADNANLNRTTNGDDTMNAKNRYVNQNERVHVIGGLKSKPSNTAPHRVRIHVNQNIGGKSGEINRCALRTGTWNNGTDLIVDVGGEGAIYGGGGAGGQGGDVDSSGHAGEDGASALGIDFNTTVNVASGGLLRCGFGGGGGGGAGRQNDKGSERTVGGGGGGGGQGYPGGAGGSEGNADHGQGPGSAGDLTEAGEGGGGGNNGNQAYSGHGGEGGGQGEAADAGAGGNHGAGAGGGQGSAIRKASGSVSFSLNNSGSIVGNTDQIGVN